MQLQRSLNDHIQEFVPVCWLEPAQAHGQAFDFLHNLVLHVVLSLLLFLIF